MALATGDGDVGVEREGFARIPKNKSGVLEERDSSHSSQLLASSGDRIWTGMEWKGEGAKGKEEKNQTQLYLYRATALSPIPI